MQKKRLGIIVNPVAGMGGKVGLKGTDGVEILRKARRLGATPESPQRTIEALEGIRRIRDEIQIFTYPAEMGENEAKRSLLSAVTLGLTRQDETTREDTLRAAIEMKRLDVDLLLFAGGDGTARDIYNAIGQEITVLGIPAGVKIHSAVYAVTPRHAGEIAANFLTTATPRITEAEVMDIDEESFRNGVISAKLYGYLRIPDQRQFIQDVKSGSQITSESIQGIAAELANDMKEDCLYVFGPGTTTRDILAHLGLQKTLLGVDVVRNRQVVARDVSEAQLGRLIAGSKAKIVVTVIGGQGYIFGRGNQQISNQIISKVGKDNIIVVATKQKLTALRGRPLLVDTGSGNVDKMLSGYIRVTTGFNDYMICKVAC